MSTNALEIMRMPELFLGSSTTFETATINSNGANYAVVIQVEESNTIYQVGFNLVGRTGGSANCRIRIREVDTSTGFMVAAGAGLATTGNFDIGSFTPNANGKMIYFNLQTPLAVTRGQLIAIDFEGLGGMGGANTVTIAYRIANTFDAIGNRYRFPYVVSNANAIKREGAWYGYRTNSPDKYYGFNPNSIKSNAADTAGRAYGNFFKCPALGATLTCSGMKVLINETEATDSTIYELWSLDSSTNAVSLLTSTTLSSGLRPQGVGYNKQIFFPTPVNLTGGQFYAITVRSSANSIDYKYLQFDDSYFLSSMQSFGGLGAWNEFDQGAVEINTSTNTQTQLGRLYLMNPLISSINAGSTIGSFTANFNSFNG